MNEIHIEKQWIHSGYLCAVVINSHMGFRCGYVGVDMEHPLYGKDGDSVDIDVYGGLTYSNDYHALAADGVWWFGFDCMHGGDMFDLALIKDSKTRSHMNNSSGFGCAKTLEFCEEQCNSMADQLEEIKFA